MSIQWTVVAIFLYTEIALVLLLVLPILSAKKWSRIFKSKFLQVLQKQAFFYFFLLLGVLFLFLADSIREMRKYSSLDQDSDHKHLDAEMQSSMRLFRAQRNFYISGFALFLALVIRRLASLISEQANLLAQSEAAIRQAQSASATAKTLLSQKGSSEQSNDLNEAHEKEVEDLKQQIKELEDELRLEVKDKHAMKEQARNLSLEYDRLAEEHSKLQKKITAGGDKKDE